VSIYIVGSVLRDWLLGKSRNPRISFIDLKFVLFRSATIASVLYNFAVLAKSYDETENYHNYTLLLAVGMQLMYVADTLWFESNLLSLREIYHDGCGCITLVATMSIPFGYSLATRYIASTNIDLPWYCLMFIVIVFCKYIFLQVICQAWGLGGVTQIQEILIIRNVQNLKIGDHHTRGIKCLN